MGSSPSEATPLAHSKRSSVIPFTVADSYAESSSSFLISGVVDLKMTRTDEWSEGGIPRRLSFTSHQIANATYNRSTDATRKPFVERSITNASFSAPEACYEQEIQAEGGEVTFARVKDECLAKEERSRLCDEWDECAAARAGYNLVAGGSGGSEAWWGSARAGLSLGGLQPKDVRRSDAVQPRVLPFRRPHGRRAATPVQR